MRVLLATDGSADARAAARWLRDFPLPAGASVHVLTVMALPALSLGLPRLAEFHRGLVAEGTRLADETAALLGRHAALAERRVLEGSPAAEIVHAAEAWPADLVVVGARGLGAAKAFVLGSVSQTVARHAPCPALVVKGKAGALRSLLVATDGSEGAAEAIRFVLTLPLGRDVRVRLLSAVEQVPFPRTAPAAIRRQLRAMLDEIARERGSEVGKLLDRAAAELRTKVSRVTRSMPTGHPAEEILAAAAAFDADLVVLGARGLGGMKRLLLGSVSERVLRDAHCPVLIVKRPPPA